MIWNTIGKKIDYLILLSLTKTVKLIVHLFFKDAELFLQHYPLLTAERSAAWHYFRLSVGEIIEYRSAKKPLLIRLTVTFSALIGFAVISLGGIIGFNQAQTLQNQTIQFNLILAAQTARTLESPLLLNNKPEMELIISNAMKETTIASASIYGSNYALIKTYGTNNNISTFPAKKIEYSQENRDFDTALDNLLGKVNRMTRYTLPIKVDNLTVGYLSLTFDYSKLERVRLKTLSTIIIVALNALIIAIIAAFYVSGRLFKLIDAQLKANELNRKINLNEDKHNPANKYQRKDELQAFMESMNQMSKGKGLLQKDKVEAFFSHYVSTQEAAKDLDTIESVKLGGEHVMASVFFADIVGFTSLSESLNPQEISDLLNVYFSKIVEVVNFCHGRVDKFIGDCAMVVFGVPEKNPQHAFSCVACGWMILQLLEQLNDKREAEGLVTVEFRIGANSGMMLAGNMGSTERMEYTVVGDSVNLASRLSGTGEPGELIITGDVFVEQGLEESVLTEEKDLIKLRGKKLPVKILNVKDILTPFKAQMLNEIPRIIAGEVKKIN